MPKINDMLFKLEGFQYATSLDLNMGYYHIRLNKTKVTYVHLFFCGENTGTSISQWELQNQWNFSAENELFVSWI